MAEVNFSSVGTPVNDPNIVAAEFNLIPGNVIFDNATSPTEAELTARSRPDFNGPNAEGNSSDPNFPVQFDNKGKNATVGATKPPSEAEVATNPTTRDLGVDGKGLPVGGGNSTDPNFPINFDNTGKNVFEFRNPSSPVNVPAISSTFVSPVNHDL